MVCYWYCMLSKYMCIYPILSVLQGQNHVPKTSMQYKNQAPSYKLRHNILRRTMWHHALQYDATNKLMTGTIVK